MVWNYLLAIACVVLLIIVVIGRLRKTGWFNKGSIAALIVIFFAAGNVFNIQYHKALERERETQFASAMKNSRLWPILLEHEPAMAANLQAQIRDLLREGASEQRAVAAIEPQIFALKRQRLQFAPDESALAWMREILVGVEGDTCLDQNDSVGAVQTKDAEFSMLRASWGPDKHTVTSEERHIAEQDMESLASKLQEKYGDDVQLLSHPEKAQGQQTLYCALSRDFFNTMLELPAPRAAALFRLSMGAEGQ